MEKQQLVYKSVDLENDNDVIFYKTIEKKLSFYEDSILYAKVMSIFALLSFLILLTLNICFSQKFSWLYLMVPGLLTIILWTIVANLYLRVEEIIDSLDKKDANVNIGTLISYFCVNIVSIALIAYLILFCLRMNNLINAHFSLIAIPLYILIGVGCFYFVFILPALIHQGMYFELLVIISYIVNFFLFLIMVNHKVDTPTSTLQFSTILTPFWIALGIHFLFIVFNCIIKEENFLKHGFFYLFLAAFLAATICLSLNFDSKKSIPTWITCSLSIIAVVSFTTEFFIHYVVKQDDYENKKQ